MAEEVTQAADQSQETPVQTPAPEQSPVDNVQNVTDIPTTNALPAKPESIDLYKYVVGNPLTGSNPGNKGQYDPVEALKKANNQVLSTPSKGYELMTPYTYSGDFDGANFDRYYKSPVYKTLGFSPYRDNESLYNDNMTFGDEFVRAASVWPSLVKTGFVSTAKAIGDLFTDPLNADVESAREMKRIMAVGASSKGGVGGFITNTFLNSGYTIGVGLELLGEELALMATTALTGGLASEVTAPAMLGRIFKAGEKIAEGVKTGENIIEATKAAGKATDAYKAIDNINDARSFWNGVTGKTIKAAGNIINPLDNTIDALRSTDYATDYAKVIGTFGGFARDVMMTKAGVSEAKLEAGMTKIDTTEELIKLYREQNGADPTGEELQKIENIANQQAYKTAVWNLPAILWSNKFMYETMLAPIDKLVKPNVAKFADDIIFDKKTFAAAGEGFFARTKLAAKALKDPKVYGRYAFDYLKGNLAEGIQENLQEAIGQASAEQAIDLYKDPATADYQGYMSYMLKGLNDQFSAKGAETFASGFAMSLFASPMMSGPSYAISKSLDLTVYKNKVKDAKEARDKQRAEEIRQLNEFYKNDIAFLAPDLPNAIKQQKMSDDLAQALEDGDILKARNIKDEAVFEHIHTALRTGKYDVFLKKLKDYKNLSPEEAKDAFKEYGIEDGNQALKYIDKAIARAESIKNNYETVSNEMPNPFNFKQFAPTNPLYRANLVANHAWEEAKKKLIFSRDAFTTLSDRIEKMTQTFSKLGNSIAKSDVQTFMSLMSPESAITEINTLKRELSALDSSIPEQKSVIKDKTKKLELLEKFYDSVSQYKFNDSEENKEAIKKETKKHFKNVLKYVAGKNNSLVFDKTVDEAYQTILDNITLSDERKGLVESINVLTNPEGFLSVQRRLANVYNQIIDDKENTLKYNSDVFTGRRESNITLNAIYQATGLILKPEDLKALRDAIVNGTRLPKITSFVDKSTEEELSGDNAKFKVAMKIWEDRLPLIKSEEEIQEEIEEEELKEDIIIDDPSTYPQDLMDELEAEYNRRIESGALDEMLTFQDFVNLPFSRPIVKKYIQKRKEKLAEKADIYSGMTTDQLKAEFKALSEKENRTSEENLKLVNIENTIVLRELKDALSPEQIKALEKLESLSKSAKKKDDQSGYVVDGEDYNLRVTKLKDRILNEEYKGPKFDYAGKQGKRLVDAYEKALKDISTKSKYPEVYAQNIIDNIIYQLEKNKTLSYYKNILTKNKLNELKSLLAKDPESIDVFKEAVNIIAFKESKDTGDIVDEIARLFFEGKPITKRPSNMKEKDFNNLIQALTEVREKLREKGEFIVSRGIKVFGKYNVKGSEEKVAGELDLLVIDKDGNFKIYDVKTSKDWTSFGTEEDETYKKKKGYTLQLSIYKKMIEDLTGIPVTSISLLPIEAKTDADGNIISVKSAFDAKNTDLEYDPIVEEYLQPSTIVDTESWEELINAATTDDELNAVMDAIDAEDAMTPELITAINIKRNSLVPEEEQVDNVEEQDPYEQIGKYFISEPFKNDTGGESIIIKSGKGVGYTYEINTDENGSIISLTPKNNLSQRLTNERLLVAVEIKRNKSEYNRPIVNKIANSEAAYNRAKMQIPVLDLVENTLNFGLTNEILENIDKLYSNRKLSREDLIAIQIWANSTATRLESILEEPEYKNSPEINKAWENMYIINELASNKLAKIKIPVAKAERREPTKSVNQLQKERDAELKFIQEKRSQLGIEFDPLDDLPLSVVVTMERFEAGLPIDPVSVFETSDWLYNKYKQLTDMQLDPNRLLTIKQIKSYQKALEKDIRALEKYKQQQYGEQIIPDETAKGPSTPEQRGEPVAGEQKQIKETSFDEPIKRKAKRDKQAKVEKVKKETPKQVTITDEEPDDVVIVVGKKKKPTLVEKPTKITVKKPAKSKKVVATPTTTDAKVDIERRRQEELDKTNAQLEKIEKNGDSFIRAKIEVYTTLSNEETLDEVEIITFKDGSRRIRITDSKTGELILDEKIKKDNSTTNEKFIEEWVGNLDNTLKKISEDNNPNKTVVDKINAKYDAELDALESKPAETQVLDVEAFNSMTVEEKYKEISKELKDDNILFGTYRKGNYNTYDGQSYEVVLDDGRILRAIPINFNKKDAEGKPVVPEGQRVAIKVEFIEKETGVEKAIGIFRVTEQDVPKALSFSNLRKKTPEYQIENQNINLTLADINKELNINSLIVAKERGYEVVYSPIGSFENPTNYLVKNIDRKGKKEVTLYSPVMPGEVVISIDSIPSVIKGIVDPKSANIGQEDKNKILKNKNSIQKPSTSFDNNISEDDALNNLLNNLCS